MKCILIAVSTNTGFVTAWTRAGLKPLDDPFFQAEQMEPEAARFAKARLREVDVLNSRTLRITGSAIEYHVIPIEKEGT